MSSVTRGALFGAALGLSAFAGSSVVADNLIISTGLGQPHIWVAHLMNPFADAMSAATKDQVSFTKFYAGELSPAGRELDALQSGVIHIAAPLLAPYHEGRFPLSDVTQLPTYGTSSPMVTRAFQNLLDSAEPLSNGKSFYETEIGGKGIKVWAIGATAGYSISTPKKELKEPGDFKGTLLRAGAALHTMMLEGLGATPTTIPGPQIYEALTRGTVDGIIISIADWPSYSIQDLLNYTITDMSIGHWESYLAISDAGWAVLSAEEQAEFDKQARAIATSNAEKWESNEKAVRAEVEGKGKAKFISLSALSPAMSAHIDAAARDTWIKWIERTEAAGHPARSAATHYARLITAEGGTLPAGVQDYLKLD